MRSDDEAARQRHRELVRLGYDKISVSYRTDSGDSNPASSETAATYGTFIAELQGLLQPGARVLDLGCGAGVPATRALVDAGLVVTGIDFSEVQIERAKMLVPEATFVCADMAVWDAAPDSFEAVVSFYTLIHVPLDDQRGLIPRLARWLVTGGYLLAIVGHERWTGVEQYMGAPMFWDHADTATYCTWLREADFEPLWHRFVPEGASGHTLVLAQRR